MLKINFIIKNIVIYSLKKTPLYEYADEINDFTLFSKLNDVVQQVKFIMIIDSKFFFCVIKLIVYYFLIIGNN